MRKSDDGQTQEYVVEKIESHRGKPGHREYEIKWRGFDAKENTWEPETKIAEDVPDKVRGYLKKKGIQGVN